MVGTISNNLAYYVREHHFDRERMAGTIAHWKNNAPSKNNNKPVDPLSLVDDKKESLNNPPSVSFGELLDVVNPMHHLPLVGNVYRNMTGDQISPVAQIIGGSIYGGPIGGLTSLANVAVQEHSGQDLPSAIKSSIDQDQARYVIEEDERTAGIRKSRESLDETVKTDDAIHVVLSSSVLNPISKPSVKQEIDWKAFYNEKREPVTRVSIDLAAANVKKQQWNFNV